MANSHEKADVIIVNEVMSAARQGYNTIHIVCDDRGSGRGRCDGLVLKIVSPRKFVQNSLNLPFC